MKKEDCKDSPLGSVVQPQQDARRAIESSVQPGATVRKWPRYQFVLWWPADWTIGLDRFEDSWMKLIYRWSFSFGPLEIRRWKDREATADKATQIEQDAKCRAAG